MNRSKPYSPHYKGQNEFKPISYKKKPSFTMTDEEFPDLIVTTTTEQIQEKEKDQERKVKETKNYMEAALKERPIESMKNNTLPEGWIGYYYNDEKKVVKVDNSQKYQPYEEDDEENNSKAEQITCYNALLRNLLQYQIYYDGLNGEGEYERVYSMKEDKYTIEEE
jgi:hypothetical protein